MRTEEKKQPEPLSSVDQLIEQRKRLARMKQLRAQKRKLFRLAIWTALVLMAVVYWTTDRSRVQTVRIEGQSYLSRQQILALAGIDENSRWLLQFSPQLKSRLEASPMIASASVSHGSHNEIRITIEERKPVGYRYLDQPEVLFADGTVAPMDESLTGLIGRIPLITGFESQEQTADLAMAFREVDAGMISLISEISQVEVSYDPNMICLLMQDGNRFFSSYYSMDVLNSYNSIVSNLNQSNACIFVDEMSKSAYTQPCPQSQSDTQAQTENESSDTNPEE